MANGRGAGMRDQLREVARLYGVLTTYDDATGRSVEASDESLLAVLPALGAAIEKREDAPDVRRERLQSLWRQRVEPVTVAWNGDGAVVEIRLPTKRTATSVDCTLRLEDGEERAWSGSLEDAPNSEAATVEGVTYSVKRVAVPGRLPFGYHRLTLEFADGVAETLIISAPVRAFSPQGRGWERSWGVFLPLYSLHSRRSWGAGDFGDLEALADWVQNLGGNLIGTLPLMPAFLDEPYEISPYSPVSRLFWNEFYLDLERIPEVQQCPAAKAMFGSADVQARIDALRTTSLVDYRQTAAAKRRVLEIAARSFFTTSSDRREGFERYLASHSYAADYAVFRAVGERLRKPWSEWPEPVRDGTVRAGDFDEDAKRYHLFVQWLADEQLKTVSDRARTAGGGGLYLDLPLGVHAAGYDTWREREAFAVGVAGGAPPDPGFPKGQNWGFVPLHPEGIRRQGYRYVRAFVRHQLQFASVLRIDHMPNFHRVYWIPPGRDASEGAYVRYPADELYALFSLESHRHRTLLIGEDLGTVPPEVPTAMARHNFHRMSVTEYELKPDPAVALPDPPAASLACVNTHDMPPFAAYWKGSDINERKELGLIDAAGAEQEEQFRLRLRESLTTFLQGQGLLTDAGDAATVLRALLDYLRDSPARVVLVNLEDLWCETEPQNVPSTSGDESPNWRRKARYSLEEFTRMPEVLDALREIARGFASQKASGEPAER